MRDDGNGGGRLLEWGVGLGGVCSRLDLVLRFDGSSPFELELDVGMSSEALGLPFPPDPDCETFSVTGEEATPLPFLSDLGGVK